MWYFLFILVFCLKKLVVINPYTKILKTCKMLSFFFEDQVSFENLHTIFF